MSANIKGDAITPKIEYPKKAVQGHGMAASRDTTVGLTVGRQHHVTLFRN